MKDFSILGHSKKRFDKEIEKIKFFKEVDALTHTKINIWGYLKETSYEN